MERMEYEKNLQEKSEMPLQGKAEARISLHEMQRTRDAVSDYL